MSVSLASIHQAEPVDAACRPQELISNVAGVDEAPPNPANIESNKKNWRAVQAAGAAAARDVDREVRLQNYAVREKVYGPIDAPYLLGPEPLSLARYLRAPEVRDWIISQHNSHAMKMFEDLLLEEGLDGSNGDGAGAVLTKLVKRYAAEQPEGLRYWQRTKNVIWKPFLGLLTAREHNLKARRGEEDKLIRRNHRAEKEKVRLASRGDPVAERKRKEASANLLRAQSAKLHAAAKKKQARAREWFADAERLSIAAQEKQAQAAAIERVLSEDGGRHVERAPGCLGQGGCHVLV